MTKKEFEKLQTEDIVWFFNGWNGGPLACLKVKQINREHSQVLVGIDWWDYRDVFPTKERAKENRIREFEMDILDIEKVIEKIRRL